MKRPREESSRGLHGDSTPSFHMGYIVLIFKLGPFQYMNEEIASGLLSAEVSTVPTGRQLPRGRGTFYKYTQGGCTFPK